MTTVEINNLKGIKHLAYSIPDKPGVFILSGSNGCGKTTLLIAIDRIGNSEAFRNFVNCEHASISYDVNGNKVVYTKNDKRWSPKPRNCGAILKNGLYRNTLYLSATGARLYQQERGNLQSPSKDAPASIKDALNLILDTSKYNNLKYIAVSPKKGRQKQLHRKNILYVVKDGKEVYSEEGFSLGERMLLNALDYINNIEPNSILLIDEIELALHPIAQVRFYYYLCNVARERKLTIIISTHSSTLIKQADVLHYLENTNGIVETNYNATPALVLKEVSIETDNKPDYIFFIEDEMASCYMKHVLCEYRNLHPEDANRIIKLIPVGGYKQVVELMKRMQGIPPFNERCLHCFLDNDVEEKITEIRNNPQKENGEQYLINLFRENARHISFLHITPELGVWNELEKNHSWLEQMIEERFGKGLFKMGKYICEIQQNIKGDNERRRAKDCIRRLCQHCIKHIGGTESEIIDIIFKSYVNYKLESKVYKDDIVNKIKLALNKK